MKTPAARRSITVIPTHPLLTSAHISAPPGTSQASLDHVAAGFLALSECLAGRRSTVASRPRKIR